MSPGLLSSFGKRRQALKSYDLRRHAHMAPNAPLSPECSILDVKRRVSSSSPASPSFCQKRPLQH